MKQGKPYRGYSLASLSCSLSEFYDLLEEISGVKKPPFKYIPDIFVTKGARVIDLYNRYVKGEWNDMYDPVRAEMSSCDWSVDPVYSEEDLNFYPRDARESLAQTIEWIYKNEPQQRSRL